jgi:hypothetical protein
MDSPQQLQANVILQTLWKSAVWPLLQWLFQQRRVVYLVGNDAPGLSLCHRLLSNVAIFPLHVMRKLADTQDVVRAIGTATVSGCSSFITVFVMNCCTGYIQAEDVQLFMSYAATFDLQKRSILFVLNNMPHNASDTLQASLVTMLRHLLNWPINSSLSCIFFPSLETTPTTTTTTTTIIAAVDAVWRLALIQGALGVTPTTTTTIQVVPTSCVQVPLDCIRLNSYIKHVQDTQLEVEHRDRMLDIQADINSQR